MQRGFAFLRHPKPGSRINQNDAKRRRWRVTRTQFGVTAGGARRRPPCRRATETTASGLAGRAPAPERSLAGERVQHGLPHVDPRPPRIRQRRPQAPLLEPTRCPGLTPGRIPASRSYPQNQNCSTSPSQDALPASDEESGGLSCAMSGCSQVPAGPPLPLDGPRGAAPLIHWRRAGPPSCGRGWP